MSDEIDELTRVKAVIAGLSSPTDREFVYATDQFSERAIAGAAALTGGGGGSLPDWWTVDSTPGSESVEFAGAVEIEPGRDVTALVLRGDAGQVEHIFRAYNADGDLCMDIDANGRTDVLQFVVQNPPDTGGGAGASSSTVSPSTWNIASGVDATDNPLRVRRLNDIDIFNDVFQIGRLGSIVRTNPVDGTSNETGFEIGASQDGTGNAIELWDYPFNNMLFGLGYNGEITARTMDNTQTPLTLQLAEADPDVEGEPLLKIVDEVGAFLGSWDTDGGIQCESLFIPDQVTTRFAVSGTGAFISNVQADTNPVAIFKTANSTLMNLRSGAGVVLSVSSVDVDDVVLELDPSTGQIGDLLGVFDESYDRYRFRINKAGYPVIANNAAPADGDLAANECAIWFDSTDGAAKLMLKAKQADGTVKTGSVNVQT